MTLIWARVDQKLIHGQVSIGWVPHLSIDAMIVADHDVEDDSWAQKIMTMSMPPQIKLSAFVAPKALSKLLSGEEYRGRRIMVLFKSIAALLEAVEYGFWPETLNLGNQASSCPKEDVRLTDCFFAKIQDLECLKLLQEKGLKILLQSTPAGKMSSLT